jgi:hypothetical protein
MRGKARLKSMTRALDDTDRLIGAITHDVTHDPFPVNGLDHIRSTSATPSRPRTTTRPRSA